MALRKLVLFLLCLVLAACGSLHSVDTHQKTVPIYQKKF